VADRRPGDMAISADTVKPIFGHNVTPH
jgi:hypothetical protein